MNPEQRLLKNWTDGAQNYSSLIKEELASFQKQAWTDIILENAGKTGSLDVLDVGCGPGFFTIIMALAGHRVTAVDCTEAMVATARANVEEASIAASIAVSDSHSLNFEDESFDLVISRNVAWTLIDAPRAFAEWRRVLRPGARTIIFDANWNRYLFDPEQKRKNGEDIAAYIVAFCEKPIEHSDEGIAYRKTMPMCQRIRPQWDLGALIDAGFSKIYCDTNINERVYDEKRKILNRSTPMFMIVAQK